MSHAATPQRSRVPWALAVTVGLCSGLAGYVIRVAQDRRAPKQVVLAHRLTDMPGLAESPAISPDGKVVAFIAASGGKKQVWVKALADYGMPHAVTNDDTDHAAPRWSSDSKTLIYFSSDAVWEVPVTGEPATKLVDASAPGDLSHIGKGLAYFRVRDGVTELVAVDRSVAKLAGQSYSNLRWSPDDKKLAYLQNQRVMVVNASGGEPVRAIEVPLQGFAWAPDSSGLIGSLRGELLFIPRLENGTPAQLTFGELAYESPDIDRQGNVVVSRRGLYVPGESDIVMFSGLKW